MADQTLRNTLPDDLPDDSHNLEQAIASHERKSSPLRPGTEAKIVWDDKNSKAKTPFSIVYLHGLKGVGTAGRRSIKWLPN